MIELSHKLGVTNHMTLPFVGHAYIFFGSDEGTCCVSIILVIFSVGNINHNSLRRTIDDI